MLDVIISTWHWVFIEEFLLVLYHASIQSTFVFRYKPKIRDYRPKAEDGQAHD
jgi:hypothetical protein